MGDRNGVMMQAFHWYTAGDGSYWRDLARRAPELAAAGVDAIWLPPAGKAKDGASDVGYAVYDLYDLGEFDQKGSVRTKYGTKAEYVAAVKALQAAGVKAIADTVLNHRVGCDGFEPVRAVPFLADDRRSPSGPAREIMAPTAFTFPGRGGAYSDFTWHWRHFDGCDYDHNNPADKETIYLFDGKRWDGHVSPENGNYDYLLGADVDFDSEEVGAEMTRWGKWFLDTAGVDGFRFDAAKHVSAPVFPAWLERMEQHAGRELFAVAEYWSGDVGLVRQFLDAVGPRVMAFDVPLHWSLYYASRAHGEYDMRRVLDGSLVKERPASAATFVDNHDSQPLQALESTVEPWFVPLAYALILLRKDGYPCLFYPDYFGAEYEDTGWTGERRKVVLPSHRFILDVYLRARREHNHGDQADYFDHWNRVGWVRYGDERHPKAMAVLLSDGPGGSKAMDTRRPPGTRFHDLTGHVAGPVTVGDDGRAEFRCAGRAASVWVEE